MKKETILTIGIIIFGSTLTIFAIGDVLWAETVYLKNGRKVQGKIVEKNEKLTKVDVSGVKVTYYADEIDHIEETAPSKSATTAAPLKPEEKVVKPPVVIKPDSPPPLPIVSPSPETKLAPNPSPNFSKGDKVFTAPMPEGTKKELILALIDAMGTKEAIQAMFDQINEQASAQEKEKLKGALSLDEVLNRLIPVYDKYFSEEEVKVLISFYQSPVGKKLIKVTPALMEDSMKANVSYFQEVIPKSLKQ